MSDAGHGRLEKRGHMSPFLIPGNRKIKEKVNMEMIWTPKGWVRTEFTPFIDLEEACRITDRELEEEERKKARNSNKNNSQKTS